MAKKPLPSPEVLRQLLRYEPETGKLFWLERPESSFSSARIASSWNSRYAGFEALISESSAGYLQGRVNGILMLSHRVAFAIQYGRWPESQIDHINGNKCDNRIENIREATNTENQRNRGVGVRNLSGLKGVSWYPRYSKWAARCKIDGVNRTLGYFETKSEAQKAYALFIAENHGGFANDGRNRTEHRA